MVVPAKGCWDALVAAEPDAHVADVVVYAEYLEEPAWLAVGLATEIDPEEGVQVQDAEDQLTVGEMHVQGAGLQHHVASDVLAEAANMIVDLLPHVLKGSEIVQLDEADDRHEVVGTIAAALVDAGAASEIEDVAAEVGTAFAVVVAGQQPADDVEDEVAHMAAPGRLLLELQALQMADYQLGNGL